MKTFFLILLLASADSFVDLKQQHQCKRRYAHLTSKRTFYSAPISYYSNHCSCYKLMLSGDVEINPGPVLCTSCEKTVRINSKRLECLVCKEQLHYKCSKMNIQIKNARIPYQWTCHSCTLSSLPYFNIRDLDYEDISAEDDTVDDPHLDIFSQKGTKIGHLNTQSISSTFTEFEKLMNTYKFDIITLSETWLKDDKNLLNHVKIPGYKPEYNHRATRGGGVGMYIRTEIKYKPRKDIMRFDPGIEHLWIEVKGRNKNHSYLVASVYQLKLDAASKDA